MPNQFLSPEGDLENYFVTEYQLIDQYIGDELFTWGSGTSGQLGTNTATNKSTPVTTFAGGTNWKQVSGGYRFCVAIKTDGTLWTWGVGNSGQLGDNTVTTKSTPVTTFAGGTNWKQVSGGFSHCAAIKTDGTLWTWGQGTYGQLGDNLVTVTNKSTPVTTFAGGTNWKQVSSGNSFSAAIKTDGTLWTWGLGTFGQLGRLGVNNNRLTPVTTFAGGTNWANTSTAEPEDLYTISSGIRNASAAIKTDGTLWIWGDGGNGILGTNDATSRFTPVTTFAGGTNWKQVSFGGEQCSAIKTDGTLWTWGRAFNGQLGDNVSSNAIFKFTPITTFAGGTNWKQVSGGYRFCVAIKTDGTLWTWGNGNLTPVTTFAGGTNWKQVSAGNTHTAAIKTDGTLWTWGNGGEGQLGDNTTTSKATPVTTFAGGTNWKQVDAGYYYCAAIKTDGTLWTWGAGSNGRLGNNTTTNKSTPVTTFAGGTNWKQVSSGNSHCAAIKTDGTLWTWGNGTSGQLGDNTITEKSTPVTTFAGGTNWKQVFANGSNTLALLDDGVNKQLFVFGDNTGNQLGFGNPKNIPNQVEGNHTNWKQVSSGNTHTAAIKTDGTLWTWGRGNQGQLGDNTATTKSTPVTTFAGGTNWKQVSSGNSHCAAIKTDGTLWTWGNGTSGQLGALQSLTVSGTMNNNSNIFSTTNTQGVEVGMVLLSSSPNVGAIGAITNISVNSSITFTNNYSSALSFTGLKSSQTEFSVSSSDPLNTSLQVGATVASFVTDSGTTPLWTTVTTITSQKIIFSPNSPTGFFSGTINFSGGGNYTGDLVFGYTQMSTPVTTFAGGTNWKQVSGGDYHCAAIKTDGTLWTWGYGVQGQLGTNTATNKSTPVTTFAGGTNWKQVSAGSAFSAAVTAGISPEYPLS